MLLYNVQHRIVSTADMTRISIHINSHWLFPRLTPDSSIQMNQFLGKSEYSFGMHTYEILDSAVILRCTAIFRSDSLFMCIFSHDFLSYFAQSHVKVWTRCNAEKLPDIHLAMLLLKNALKSD